MILQARRSVLVVVDVQARLAPAVAGLEPVLARLDLLLHTARETGVPVVFTEQYPRGLGRTLPALAEAAPAARVVEKTAFGACGEAGFVDTVTAGGRDLAVVCGMEAHVCVLQTALGLAEAKVETVLLSDASASRRAVDHDAAMARAAAAAITVATAEMAVFEWLARADTAAFRAVQPKIKALA
ncbi:MAG: isochorismatase family protein [Deinococcus-Thermus bacterium]|jgi:nicotinamidase-related amidase|nr:isochorismatase family protein [Deinococcota bacterium]